jgi:hypothetical protein
MTDLDFQQQDTSASDRVDAARRIAAERKPGFADTLFAAMEQSAPTVGLLQHIGGDSFVPDPNFHATPEYVQGLSDKYQVPLEYLKDLHWSTSDAHAQHIAQSAAQELQNKQTLAESGWQGTAASMFATVADPLSMASMVTPAGVAGWAEKGGAIRAAIKGGLLAGGQNAAVEGLLTGMQHTSDAHDVVDAGLTGFMLGLGPGALAGHMANRAANVRAATMLQSLKDSGVDLSQFGEVELTRSATGELPKANPPVFSATMTHDSRAGPITALRDDPMWFAPEGQGPYANEPMYAGRVTSYKANVEFRNPLDEAKATPEQWQKVWDAWRNNGEDVEHLKSMREVVESGDKAGDFGVWLPPGFVKALREVGYDGLLLKAGKANYREAWAVALNPQSSVKLESPTGEVVGAQVPGSVGAAAVGAPVAPVQSTAFLKLRAGMGPLADPFAKITSWGEHWADIANRLIDDPVGNKTIKLADGTTVKPASGINAAEWASMEMKRYESSADSALHDAWTSFAQRNKLNWFNATQDVQRSFYEDVTRALRGDSGTIARNPEAAQAAQKIGSLNGDVLDRMKKLGVEGADAVDPNAFYVMRKYDFDKIRLLSGDKDYRGAMHRLVSEAIQKAQPALEAERAETISKNFVKRLRDIPTDRTNLGFLSDQGFERFAASLRQGGVFSEQEIDDILGHVYGDSVKTEGEAASTSPRLKKRTFLDETHSVTFKDSKGTDHTLGFQDLLVNDIRLLNRSYFKQTTGLMGLAKVGIQGRSDIDAMLRDAVGVDKDAGVVDERVNQRRDYVERLVRGITGVPMYEGFGSRTEKLLRTLKNFNFVNNMAQGAMAQVAELGQIVSLQTSMALRSQVPEFEHVLNLAKDGKMPKALRRDLEALGSVASEVDLRKPVPAYLQGDSIDQALTKADNRMAQAASAIGRASGMSALNDFERYTIAQLYTNRLLRLSAGMEKMDDAMAARLATNGIEGADLERFFENVRKHVEVDPATKQVVGIDYEAWEKDHPRSYDQFRLAIHREAYRSIQETSLGATPVWMHSSTGRLIAQFRSFVMNAWTKQTLYGLNHADPQTFMQFAFTTLFGGLSYVAQTTINHLGDQKALDEKLSTDQIALAAWNRAGWSSLAPGAIDSLLGMTTGQKMFTNGRTTNLSSDWITGIPTVSLLDKIWGGAGAVTQSVLPDSMLPQPHVWTQKEVGGLLGLLPNYYGVRTYTNDVKQDFPTHNPFAAKHP